MTTGAASADALSNPTLGEWLDRWLGLCVLRGLRPTTLTAYRKAISLYVPRDLSSMGIRAIRPQHLNDLYARMLVDGRRDGRGGLSQRTVRLLHAILKRSLTDAVRLDVLEKNPAEAADAPSHGAARSPVFPTWTPSELRRFLVAARNDDMYAAFHLAASTGLRRSELLGLRWCDVDFERRQLRVIQTVVLVGLDVEIGMPKTNRSRRVVALDRQTVDVLREHRAQAVARAEALGRDLDDAELLFCGEGGRPLHPTLFGYYFQRRVRASGVRKIRFHDLRHTHATHALQAGIHPKIVSERLGHATITITLDTYSHALPSLQGEAAEVIAALLEEPRSEPHGVSGTAIEQLRTDN